MMARFDDPPALTAESFTSHLLMLDAMAHHYGRVVAREMPGRGGANYTADGAYSQLSKMVHQTLVQHLKNPEFEAEAHRLIKWGVKLSLRHHRRRRSSTPKPPIPTVALAYFIQQHTGKLHAEPCFPWWWPISEPLVEDQPPDLAPYLGDR